MILFIIFLICIGCVIVIDKMLKNAPECDENEQPINHRQKEMFTNSKKETK